MLEKTCVVQHSKKRAIYKLAEAHCSWSLVPCQIMASRKQKDTANSLSWYAEWSHIKPDMFHTCVLASAHTGTGELCICVTGFKAKQNKYVKPQFSTNNKIYIWMELCLVVKIRYCVSVLTFWNSSKVPKKSKPILFCSQTDRETDRLTSNAT